MSHWDGSFKRPKHMFKLMGKKIMTILPVKKFPYLDLWGTNWKDTNMPGSVLIVKCLLPDNNAYANSEDWEQTYPSG